MKRTNIYLEDSMIERVTTLAKERGVKAAEALREILRLGIDLYEVKGVTADIEFVRQKMIQKHGKEVSYQDEFDELAREKAIEYRDMQNNRARITDIVNRLTAVEGVLRELITVLFSTEDDK